MSTILISCVMLAMTALYFFNASTMFSMVVVFFSNLVFIFLVREATQNISHESALTHVLIVHSVYIVQYLSVTVVLIYMLVSLILMFFTFSAIIFDLFFQGFSENRLLKSTKGLSRQPIWTINFMFVIKFTMLCAEIYYLSIYLP